LIWGSGGQSRFNPDQNALIKLAQEAVKMKGGLTTDEIEIIKKWADEYGLGWEGPEIHPNKQGMSSWRSHIHLGGTKLHFWEWDENIH